MPATENQRLAFRDKFRSLHYEAFQSWFEELMRAVHSVGDFQAVRKTQGDGGLDGFVISSQMVYAVYAPARRKEDRDSETAAKIRTDFEKAATTLAGRLKTWVFVHNHPEGKLGKRSTTAVAELRRLHPPIGISVLGINELWEKLAELPADRLRQLFGEFPQSEPRWRSPDPEIPARIKKLLDAAKALADADRFTEAIPILKKALSAAIRSKHELAEAKIRIRIGHALFEGREDYAGAQEHFRRVLELAGESPSTIRHAALHGLADMLLWAGKLDEAEAVIHNSLEIAKVLGDQDAAARSLISLALLERSLGRAETAETHLGDAIRTFHQFALTLKGEKRQKNAHVLAVCYQNKAQLKRDDGKLEEALALYAKVEELHRESGDRLNSGKLHLLTGRLYCANADAESGFQSFKRAMEMFLELNNTLWIARTTASVARLFAQHERWEEAAKAALAAKNGFEEANAGEELVESLLFAADVFAQLVKAGFRENVRKQIYDLCKSAPEALKAQVAAKITGQMDRVHAEIDEKVRTDEAIGGFISDARTLAEKEGLHEELAECLLAEIRLLTRKEDKEQRQQILEAAIAVLKKALDATSVPKRRGHLMGELSALFRRLGSRRESMLWLRRAGEIFEQSGDVFGLANFHGSLAELHRENGSLEDEIAAHKRVLELTEGRSFHHLAAGTRINLAASLRFSGDFDNALALLAEAEAICERHRIKDFIPAIARNRSDIETEQRAGQAAAHTLPQMLCSLQQLVRYKPENTVAYLAFWYFAWKTELMAVLRAGPGISLMLVTDDVSQFMEFAAKFSNLADHFLMATTRKPTVAAEEQVLPIPPAWRFPASFPFLGIRQVKAQSTEEEPNAQAEVDAGPPTVRLSGPATMLPPYMFVSVPSKVPGEGHVSALSVPRLPQEAIDLMTRRPIRELVRRRALWFPSPRFDSKDVFLTDLRVAHERDVFPVYYNRLPSSDAVTAIAAVAIPIPASVLKTGGHKLADKWKRALLKITRLGKDEARMALLDLPDALSNDTGSEAASLLEVHLFEFTEIARKVIRPAILVRGRMVSPQPKS
ncbi:MAG TPA: tetratricopeptide repeat protein [Chthoniobacterales bacterium]|nr:tetratricopeptide repeat protein [Chthoniobacterales bacterium]